MKKSILNTLLIVAAGAFLISCNPANPSSLPESSVFSESGSPVPDSDKPGEDSSSSQEGEGDIPLNESYSIVLPASNSYSVTADKTTAKQGETVTLTVKASDGFAIKSVLINGAVIDGANDVYTFTMPNRDVRVSVTLSVIGDFAIEGTQSVPLTAGQDGIYKATIKADQDGSYSYRVKKDGKETVLTPLDIDRTRSFAAIDLSSLAGDSIGLPGGFTYDFFYDPNLPNRPCYIRRTAIDTAKLPKTPQALESLFYGSVQSSYSVYPSNVIGVDYTNTSTQEKYSWKKFNDNSSYATITYAQQSAKKDAIVYKKLDTKNNIYTVVDTYKQAENGLPLSSEQSDTTAFSGKYLLSDINPVTKNPTDDVDINYERSYVNQNLAGWDAGMYSHDMQSIDFDIMYSYRTQWEGNEIVSSSIVIDSVENKDKNGFTTTIKSSKTVDYSKDTQAQSEEKHHDDYDVTLVFDNAGALVSGKYVNTRYDTSSWDFTTDRKTGEGKVFKSLTFSYTYGDKAYDNLQPVDVSSYFAQKINPAVINTGIPETIQKGNRINSGESLNNYLVLNAEPTTALDTWQYTIEDSSNKSAVAFNEEYSEWRGIGEGVSKITISNNTSKDVKSTIDINVVYAARIRSFYIDDSYEHNGSENSSYALAFAEQKATYILGATADPSSGFTGGVSVPSDVYVTFSDNGDVKNVSKLGIKVSFDHIKGLITLDGTSVSNDVLAGKDYLELKMTINTSKYGTGNTPSVITVMLLPTDATVDTLVNGGKSWANVEQKATLTFTKQDAAGQIKTENHPYKGEVVVAGTTYGFAYGFNIKTQRIAIVMEDQSLQADGFYNSSSKEIGVLIYSQSWDGQDSGVTDSILGFYGSGEGEESTYAMFKAS